MLTFYQHNKTPKPFLAWQTPNCMCTCCQLKISSTFYVNEFLQNLNKTNFDQTHSYTITQNYTTAWPWSTLDKGESLACNIISPFYKKVQAKKFYIIRPWRMPVSLCTDMMGRVVSWLDRGTGVCIAVAVADSVVVGSLPGGLSFSRLATNWARSSAVEALASSDWHLRPFLRTFGDLSLTSPVPPNLPTLIVNEKRFFCCNSRWMPKAIRENWFVTHKRATTQGNQSQMQGQIESTRLQIAQSYKNSEKTVSFLCSYISALLEFLKGQIVSDAKRF